MKVRAAQESEQGYVMIMALVTILVLALGLSVAAQQLSSAQRALIRFEKVRQFEFDSLSARNRLAFALIKEFDQRGALGTEATAQQSIGRSEEQRATDAKLLQEQGIWSPALIDQTARLEDVLVTVLSENGLVDLASRDDLYMTYVARRMGADDPAAAVAALRDFTDADTLVSLNGAEQSSYGDTVVVPNAPLRQLSDICLVLHWKTTRLCDEPDWRARVATLSEGRYWLIANAGETALRAMLGGNYSDDVSSNLIAWNTISQSEAFFDIEMIGGRVGPRYIIILEDLDKSLAIREQLLILAPEASRPYEILTRDEYSPMPDGTNEEE